MRTADNNSAPQSRRWFALSALRPSWAVLSAQAQFAVILGILTLGLFWSYATTLTTLADRWSRDPQYSHGFLVPVFALVVLWHWRGTCPVQGLQPSWAGLYLLLLSAAMRLAAAYFFLEPLDAFSLVPALAGFIWVCFGGQTLRWSWPAVAFLGFMLPLPFQVEGLLAQPLRSLATTASTYTLQTFGYPALADGNHILIGDVRLGVADACSGLGMLMTFFALATAVTMILQPRWLDRLLIVTSAVPIALLANVVRITLTGMVHTAFGSGAGKWVHDQAGWLMMPLALGLLWLELRYLSWVLVESGQEQPLPVNFQKMALGDPSSPGREPLPMRVPGVPGSNVDSNRVNREPLPSDLEASHHDSLSETR